MSTSDETNQWTKIQTVKHDKSMWDHTRLQVQEKDNVKLSGKYHTILEVLLKN